MPFLLTIWGIVKGGASLLALLPQLFSLYNSIKKIVGDAQTESFIKDLETSSNLVVKSQDPNMGVEEKRALRREALEKSNNLWGRIVS